MADMTKTQQQTETRGSRKVRLLAYAGYRNAQTARLKGRIVRFREPLDAGTALDAGVEEVAVVVRVADERDDAPRLTGELLQRALGRADEPRAQEQVLGRVARDRELRKDEEVDSGRLGLRRPLEQRAPVAVDDVRLDHREVHERERGERAERGRAAQGREALPGAVEQDVRRRRQGRLERGTGGA